MTNGSQVADYPANEDPKLEGRLASAQRAVVGLTEMLEDSVDLFGATLREEAARVPGLLLRSALGIFAAAGGTLFLTAAAALYLRDLFGGWSLSFLALGAFYILAGVVVWKPGRDRP